MPVAFVPSTGAPTHLGAFRSTPTPLGVIPGAPFLPTILGGMTFGVRAAFGADPTTPPSTWTLTDLSGDLYQPQPPAVAIQISNRGRLDELNTTMASTCTFTLINLGGDYMFRRPTARRWPYMKAGLPVQAFVTSGGILSDRFSGYVTDLEADWDTTGNRAMVNVTAQGILERVGASGDPLQSALYRSIAGGPAPTAWWTLEDGGSATSCASSVTGVGGLAVFGSVSLGSAGPPGGAAGVDFTGGGHLRGTIPEAAAAVSGYRWSFALKIATATTGTTDVFQWKTTASESYTFTIAYAATSTFTLSRSDGFSTGGSFALIDTTEWIAVEIRAADTGTAAFHVFLNGTDYGGVGMTLPLLAPTSVVVNPATGASTRTDFSASSLVLWLPSNTTTSPAAATLGYTGEDAAVRMARLCAEESIPFTLYGTAGGRTMGAQSPASLLSLLREAELVGGGVLEDGIGFGLAYHELETRYNPTTTLATALTQITPQLSPVENTLHIRNQVTVSVPDGSSAVYTQPAGEPYAPTGPGGIGVRPDSHLLNTDDPLAPYERAAWFVHLGTVDADRYATLPYNFAARPALIPQWLACQNGSRVTVPATYPTGGQPPDGLIEGWSEGLSTFVFTADLNLSPPDPYQVGIIDDNADRGLVDADDATLASDIDAAVTSFQVAVGTLWSTSGADYPVTITVDGEHMTLTSVSGATSPQTFNVTRGVGGYVLAHSAGAGVDVTNPLLVAV